MKPLLMILALYLEPVGPVTEEPWDFVEEIETIDVIPVEELEEKLERKRYRIMEATDGDR
jgi:hypothetical protein